MIEKFVDRVPHSYYFKSLGQLRYLSLLNVVDVVLGNSSSGLTEVPSFNKPTINIGNRQSGRLMAKSVINCDPDSGSIGRALNVAFDPIFRASIHESTNPYGNGGASKKIYDVLCSIKFDGLVQKQFFDLFDNSGCFRVKSLAESICND
jgi:GDP/UDP-N,N'-diacetylbacillosamine 2-epimerase (hydrolysing)